MSNTENRDQFSPDHYVTDRIEHMEEDEDIKPPIDVTPPIDQSPNVSGTGEPELTPEPEKPSEKKGLFGKKNKKDKKNKPSKEKKEKTLTGGEGAASKLKGLFRKSKTEDTTAVNVDDNVDRFENGPGTQQTSLAVTPTQPMGYSGYPGFQGNEVPSYPSGYSSTTSPSKGPHSAKSMSSYLRRPPPIYQKEGCAEVKTPPKKSLFRCSIFIVVLLICGCIAGIIMTAMAGDNDVLNVIGPFFIGVSLFALVGKIFFTLYWSKEAHPMLKPASKAINKKMKAGPNYQQQQYAMNTYSYPRSSAYNQAYDTSPHGLPDALTAPGEYISEDDYAPYDPTPNYHEEPMPDDYQIDIKDYEEDDIKKDLNDSLRKDYDEVDIKNEKDYDEGGGPRFI